MNSKNDDLESNKLSPPDIIDLPQWAEGMAHVANTELVWPGKFGDDGKRKQAPRLNLPFQVIERINESRATREARKDQKTLSLFDFYEGTDGDSFERGGETNLFGEITFLS